MWGWSEIQVSNEQKTFWGGGISATAEVSATSPFILIPCQLVTTKPKLGEELQMCLLVFDNTA